MSYLILYALLSLSAGLPYRLDDPAADHTTQAIKLDEAADMDGAIVSFRAAVRFTPEVSEHWSNLAVALSDEDAPGNQAANAAEAKTCLEKSDELESLLFEYDLTVNVSDPFEDYNKLGIAAAKTGDVRKATQYFTAATHFSPYRQDVWNNLAIALADAVQLGKLPEEQSVLMLCEAWAAGTLSQLMGNKPTHGFEGFKSTPAHYLQQHGGQLGLAADSCDAQLGSKLLTSLKAIKVSGLLAKQ
jgi:tetratricopeptide (TPR) repeat protein